MPWFVGSAGRNVQNRDRRCGLVAAALVAASTALVLPSAGCSSQAGSLTDQSDAAAARKVPVKLQLVRSGTLKLSYAGKTILLDPMLSPKGAMDPFAGRARNPTVDLPMKPEAVVAGVEFVLITHAHPDHFDPAAVSLLPAGTPILCQPPDAKVLGDQGFKSVTAVVDSTTWGGIEITRTGGKHGSGEVLKYMGEVSGFVLRAAGEPVIYVVGDSIWNDDVQGAIQAHRPDIIVTNSGGAVIPPFAATPILMDAAATVEVARAAPRARVVAVHMEALDHCTVTRAALRRAADQAGIGADRLIIPNDGEILSLD